jgi:lysophospholipase L1-like esterase
MLHADWSCVTSSGEGAVRNNEEKAPYTAKHAEEQIERAFYTQKEPRWSNQMDDPELVILAYGENDFNDTVNMPSDAYFKEQYKKLILKLRQFRPNSYIFCMTPANTVTSQRSVPGMGGAVAELRAEGDTKVFFMDLNENGPLLNASDFLDGVHPLISGHEKIALYLRNKARTIMGWN